MLASHESASGARADRQAPSAIHGKGCFATAPFARRRKIAEYTGERITNAEAERRGRRRVARISGLDDRWSIDAPPLATAPPYLTTRATPTASCRRLGKHPARPRAARHLLGARLARRWTTASRCTPTASAAPAARRTAAARSTSSSAVQPPFTRRVPSSHASIAAFTSSGFSQRQPVPGRDDALGEIRAIAAHRLGQLRVDGFADRVVRCVHEEHR